MGALLKARGLYTLPNNLSEIPEGALLEALNVVIDRNGIVEPRRGQYQWKTFGSGASRIKQLLVYKDKMIAHYGTSLAYESTNFTNFKDSTGAGDATVTVADSSLRIKGVELNSNFYITTSEGIKKLSSTSGSFNSTTEEDRVFDTGAPKALDIQATINYTQAGFFSPLSKVSYRVVWGYRDNNNILFLGFPSSRYEITNYSETDSAIADVTFLLPQDVINTNYFYQVYRSPVATATTIAELGTLSSQDELKLVYEQNVTSSEISSKRVTVTDITPEEFRAGGTPLYTNEFTGNGILQANEKPPFAKDIAAFKNSLFFANTRTKHQATLDLLGLAGLDEKAITNGSISTTTLTVTSASHGYSNGDLVAIVIPNSERSQTFGTSDVNTSTDTITVNAHGLIDGDLVRFTSSTTLPAGLSSSNYYFIDSATTNTFKLLDENGDSVNITSTGSGTHTVYERTAIRGIYTVANTATNTFDVTVLSNTTVTNVNNAYIFGSYLVAQRSTTYNRYWFVGAAGDGNILCDTSPQDTNLSAGDYFLINSYDRERKYGIWYSVSEDGVIPSATAYSDMTGRAAVEVALTSESFSYDASSGSIVSTSADTITINDHGLEDGDRVTFDATNIPTGLVSTEEYFIINATTNTFQLSNFYNGSVVNITGLGAGTNIMYHRSGQIDVAELTAAKLTELADWAAESSYEFDPLDIDLVNDDITITAHGLSNGDRGYISSTLTVPTHSADMPVGGYYLKAVDANTLELYTDAGLTSKVTFSAAGTGLLTLHTNRITFANASSGDWGFANNLNDLDDATSAGVQTGFNFTISNPGYGEYFNDANNEHFVKWSKLATPAQQIDETARSLIRVITKNVDEEAVIGYYVSGPTDVSGKMNFEASDLDDVPFYFGTNDSQSTDDFNPTMGQVLKISTIGTGATPTITTASAHGLAAGDTVVIHGSNSTPSIDGAYVVQSTPLSTTFTITKTVTVSGTAGFMFKGLAYSSNETAPNRLYFSKFQEYEAVPFTNYMDIGAKDAAILRILPLRDALIVMKEDGIYRVTGDIAPNFSQTLFDNSAILAAPDSAVVLNNLIYAFTSQGISTITETGVNIISRPIENLLTPLTLHTNFSSASFGVAYETDRSYLFWTTTKTNDTYATQAFRFNTFTQSWTRWDLPAYAGIVNLEADKLYLGAHDLNYVLSERKEFTRKDYADRQYDISLGGSAVNLTNKTITLSSAANVEVGDVLLQTQYLTLNEYNNFLKKLDLDTGPSQNTYYTDFGATVGDSLIIKFGQLVTDIQNNDANMSGDVAIDAAITAYLASPATNFLELQTAFNDLMAVLNASTVMQFSNYADSDGTYEYEMIVSAIPVNGNTVTVEEPAAFIVGPVTIYKGIKSTVIWAPVTQGDPSIMKQVRDGTILFEFINFREAEIAYASDLSASYEPVTFELNGSGMFGYGTWGEVLYGGIGSAYPLRTLIPREKQRARFIRTRFKHKDAFSKYSILGISFNISSTSERAYR